MQCLGRLRALSSSALLVRCSCQLPVAKKPHAQSRHMNMHATYFRKICTNVIMATCLHLYLLECSINAGLCVMRIDIEHMPYYILL